MILLHFLIVVIVEMLLPVLLHVSCSLLLSEGREEQPAAERLQPVSPQDEVPGGLLLQADEVRPHCNPEFRGHTVLHAQRAGPAARPHKELVKHPNKSKIMFCNNTDEACRVGHVVGR